MCLAVYRVLHGTLDKVLVASQDIYTRLVTRLETKVEQVPLGVNMDLFTPAAAEHGGWQEPPIILYVGRLSQEKDLTILFEAFRILNRRGTQLYIVGDGPLRLQTERFVRTTAHTVYAGLIPYGERLAELYATMTSWPFPAVTRPLACILEALASGIPVVAINQEGLPILLHARWCPGDSWRSRRFCRQVSPCAAGQESG